MNRFLNIVVAAVLAMPVMAQTDSTNCPTDTLNGEVVYKYQVEKSVGLYRIGVNFGVSQSEIMRMNPQLKERGLRFGETLLIPTGKKAKKEEPYRETAMPAVVVDSIVAGSADSNTIVPLPKPVIELALMLPFESGQAKQSTNAERMMAFYQGVLLAMYDSQNDSTAYRLRVYDIGRSERRVEELCDSTELDSVQGVLGLAYPIQVERMGQWCRAHNVPLIAPFSSEIDLANQANILQFNIGEQQAADSICRWLKNRENIHCVTVETNESETSSSILTLRQTMRKQAIPYKKLALKDLMNDSADYALDTVRENLIILHCDRYQAARLALTRLKKLRDKGYSIRVLGQYSWQKENIGLPMIYPSVFTADSDRLSYEMLWNKYYSGGHVTEAPRYDLLGYDLMRALLEWLQGRNYYEGLQSVIHWQQVGKGGWQNTGMKIVEKD